MRRRDFIRAIAGSSVAWPVVARAQQPTMPVIGYLGATTSNERPERLRAFRRGLGETGFTEGRNVSIEYRWAEGQYDRFPELALDLVRRGVAVIAAPGNIPAARAAISATTKIPIVFSIPDDPVKLGLVTSLNRPAGNATGINIFLDVLVQKRLALLRELLPTAVRVAVLSNPTEPSAGSLAENVQRAARGLGLQIQMIDASTSQQIDEAFVDLGRDRPDALFVAPDVFFNTRKVQLTILAARYGLPTSFSARDYVEVGGLMSYGTDINDTYRQVGVYAGRILKGEKPADLPVLQETKFELIINMQTAKTLGVVIPPTLLARADEVIE
ncbi:MAG TPA: ABC transporter substrate-binding protein [Pseudolabrys sp.]|nr:ABC transporter substrate-binding protein [Pseudolabrys sp.]